VLTRTWLAFRVRIPHHSLLDIARLESGITAAADHGPLSGPISDRGESDNTFSYLPTELPVLGRGTSPQHVEGMTHTEKDPCTSALNCSAGVERKKSTDNLLSLFSRTIATLPVS